MSIPRPTSRRRPAGVLRGLPFACAALVFGAGCHDSPADPLSAVATVETVPTLALSRPLPALPELAERVRGEDALGNAAEMWERSWDFDDGEEVRVEARSRAAPVLYRELGEPAVREALASLAWLKEEPGVLGELPPVLADPLAEARILADRGERALAAGEGEEALLWTMAASDRVRVVTTPAVARRMVARAESLLTGARTGRQELDRARHLLNGARRSLAEGDWAMAVQRAFYACQVLEGPWELDPETGARVAPDSGGPG